MTTEVREQLALWEQYEPSPPAVGLRDAAAADNKTQPVHRWVPWIAGFSSQFVEDAVALYLPVSRRADSVVLDPFSGVGTTLIEALKAGCHVVGYDVNGFAALASLAKVNAVDVDPAEFRCEVESFRLAMREFESDIDRWFYAGDLASIEHRTTSLDLSAPARFRSRIPFFSVPVEAKFLFALHQSEHRPEPVRTLFRAALGATMVSYSNYSYEPSLSSRPGAGKALIDNASVGEPVSRKLQDMLDDVVWVRSRYGDAWRNRRREVFHASYFQSSLKPKSVDLAITSPPYMNNYHYVRNTRPQLHWLDLLGEQREFRELENASFGKFWQTVRQGPAVDLAFEHAELNRIIALLRTLSLEKGTYGGPGWANYVATYFNDSDRLLQILKRHLKPGGHAVIVVGNSIIQGIEFKVDELLAEMALCHGFAIEGIHIVRDKRVGNSIIESSVRNGDTGSLKKRARLYDSAVVIRA